MKKIAVLTSGGDAPGMNSAIRAVVNVAASQGFHVIGIEQGYEGLMDGRFRDLTRNSDAVPSRIAPVKEVDGLVSDGGTVLGSSRSERFRTPEGRQQAAQRLSDVLGLVVIGGNGSLTGAHLLAQESKVRVVGIPASIDNDIGCTSTAIGVDTALNTIVDACDRISDTARAHRRAFLVEVMGRESGFLAMASAVAAGADAILVREQSRDEASVIKVMEDVILRGFATDRRKQRVLILKSEAIKLPTTRAVRILQQRLADRVPGLEVRGTVLGHLVRGGSPTFRDRMVAGRLGLAAVDALVQGASDVMTAWRPPVAGGIATEDPQVSLFPLDGVMEGSSELAKWRIKIMQQLEGVMGL
mgnify:FL=1